MNNGMKALCGVILSCGCLFSQEITTGKSSNVFAPGEPLRFAVADTSPDAPGRFSICSVKGEELHSGNVALQDGRAEILISPRREWEERFLRFRYGAKDIPFVILPERSSAAGGDDRFGAWLNSDRFHEPLYKAGLRIGITTSYPHIFLNRNEPWRLKLPNQYGMALTTNLTICPLDMRFNVYQKGFRTDDVMAKFDENTFAGQVEEYHRKYVGPLGLLRVSSSLGGEFCYLDVKTAAYLRRVHRTFYAAAKRGAPDVKVALGLLMAHGVSTLQCLLDGTTPEDFPFDYLAYDICGKGDQVEKYLKEDIRRMTAWGRRVSQWVCETWSLEKEDTRTAAALARIYGASLGLGCVEVDWHSVWNECADAAEWESLIAQKKRSPVHRPMFSQALFRGKEYLPTPAAIAYYHLYRNLGHAVPLGEIQEDFNLASYQFRRKDGRIVTMLWTRYYPMQCTLKTSPGNYECRDCLGERKEVLATEKDGVFSLKIQSSPLYVITARPLVLVRKETLSHFRYSNFEE